MAVETVSANGMMDGRNVKLKTTFSVDVVHGLYVWKRSIADHARGMDDRRDVTSCYS